MRNDAADGNAGRVMHIKLRIGHCLCDGARFWRSRPILRTIVQAPNDIINSASGGSSRSFVVVNVGRSRTPREGSRA